MRFTCAMLLILSLGCTAPKKTFDVSLKNSTDGPVTVGFVKKGPPFEAKWASPEDLTNLPPSRQPANWGEIVPPGRIATIRIEGQFDRGSQPFLRVYGGEHTLAELLAISRGIGDRVDLNLTPGPNNQFLLSDRTGKLTAKLMHTEPPR